ncbi:hypothetical protein AB204_12525 [Xenorhabdus khoisanae]|uniref:Thoeris anti-defense 2-like domain-containing protein n=1 Tax=Xenorhabdus khoisanae TaxID=880157 RepID=A0A0J5INF8_9GAMM|nr:DUF2829 domain-containing protein [Xenorhabdus khoisanae]KMJ44755.1 hypothetical protein AB204_12525 [Xenorhabdus khoisanae]
MSDVIKPENECPFDPKHYQCDCFIAPVGSFSWALIQLKLRKRVTRSAWKNCQGNNEMYLAITPRVNELTVEKESAYAVNGVAVGTQYDYLTHIDLRNEHGNFVPWQPTQEDMMACDWGFVEEKKEEPVKPEAKPEPTPEPTPDLFPESALRMKGNLTVGFGMRYSHNKEAIGYAKGVDELNIGAWEEISNNTPINSVKMISFSADDAINNYYHLQIHTDDESSEKVKKELGPKKLIISCLGKNYELTDARTDLNYTLLYTPGGGSEFSVQFKKQLTESMDKPLEVEFIFVDNDFKLN